MLFRPPAFVVLEPSLDESGARGERWFVDVQAHGHPDASADDMLVNTVVVAGRSGGADPVLCSTSAKESFSDLADLRHWAVQLVLQSRDREQDPSETHAAISRHAEASWSLLKLTVDGSEVDASGREVEGVFVVVAHLADRAVLTAGPGRTAAETTLRPVETWDPYGIDLTEPHTPQQLVAYHRRTASRRPLFPA